MRQGVIIHLGQETHHRIDRLNQGNPVLLRQGKLDFLRQENLLDPHPG